MSRAGYDFDRVRAGDREAGSPRMVMADTIDWLYLRTETHAALEAAGIETVTEVRRRLAEDTLGDVAGIGSARLKAIAEAVDYHDERQLPLDDPDLRTMGAVYGLTEAMGKLAAATRLLAIRELADLEFTDALAAFHEDVLSPKVNALIDAAKASKLDTASTTTRHEARYRLDEAQLDAPQPPGEAA